MDPRPHFFPMPIPRAPPFHLDTSNNPSLPAAMPSFKHVWRLSRPRPSRSTPPSRRVNGPTPTLLLCRKRVRLSTIRPVCTFAKCRATRQPGEIVAPFHVPGCHGRLGLPRNDGLWVSARVDKQDRDSPSPVIVLCQWSRKDVFAPPFVTVHGAHDPAGAACSKRRRVPLSVERSWLPPGRFPPPWREVFAVSLPNYRE